MADKKNTNDYSPGKYREEAKSFLRTCMDESTFEMIMSKEKESSHPFVAARVFLDDSDWKKFIWIEQNGSLAGFSE